MQYSGSMREDDAFNMLNDSNIKITDNNGVERNVDFNPIKAEESGTIEEYLERANSQYFQSAMYADEEFNNFSDFVREVQKNIKKYKKQKNK